MPRPDLRPQSAMERVGLGYVHRLRERQRVGAPAWPDFADSTLSSLRTVERSALWKAALGGLVCGLVASVMAWWVELDVAQAPEAYHTWIQRWPWLLSGLLGGVPTVIEVVFLYLLGLHTVHELERAAGMPAGSRPQQAVADLALVRTALEMPNPNRVTLGIDPLRGASKLELALLTLIYKAKISITTFGIRVVVKRVLGRTVLRGLGQLASAPAYCLWNGLVFRKLVRESRLRILGPALARTIVEDLGLLELQGLAVRALAQVVVARQDLHPNQQQLLEALDADRVEVPEEDREHFVAEVLSRSDDVQHRIGALMGAALAVSGELPRRDRRLLRWLDEGPLPVPTEQVLAFAEALWTEGWMPRARIDGYVAAIARARAGEPAA